MMRVFTLIAIAALVVTNTNAALTVTGTNAQTLAANNAVATTGILSTSWVCWKAHTAVSTLTVADCPAAAGTATAFGVANAVVCGGAGTADSITWDEVTATNIALIECTGLGAGTGTKIDLVITAAAVLVHAWDFTGTTVPCISARFVHLDGAAAAGSLNIHEVVAKGSDGVAFPIASGFLSTELAGYAASKCYDDSTAELSNMCHSNGALPGDTGFFAFFDLGEMKCVSSVQVFNRAPVPSHGNDDYSARLVGTVVSLRTAPNGSPFSGTMHGPYMGGDFATLGAVEHSSGGVWMFYFSDGTHCKVVGVTSANVLTATGSASLTATKVGYKAISACPTTRVGLSSFYDTMSIQLNTGTYELKNVATSWDAASLWSAGITSGAQQSAYTLTYGIGPTDSVGGITTALVGSTRSATGVVYNGVDGYTDVNLATVALGGAMTVVGKIKWTGFNSDSMLFTCGGGQASDNIFVCNNGVTGMLKFRTYRGSTGKGPSTASTSDLVIGEWVHVVATVSGTTMTIYINGVVKATTTAGWTPTLMTRPACYIGKSNWAGDGFLAGEVASLAIYSGSMSPTQVTGIAPTQAPTQAPTGAPTAALFAVKAAYCGDVAGGKCRVEGGETMTVIGRSFGAVSGLAIKIGETGSALVCTILTATAPGTGVYVGYEVATCTTPCFVAWDQTYAVTVSGTCAGHVECSLMTKSGAVTFTNEFTAVSITSASGYSTTPTLAFVCYLTPSVVTITPNQAQPLTDTVIDGVNFGSEEPPAHISYKIYFGTTDCSSYVKTWTATRISAKNCASEGSNLKISVEIGSLASIETAVTFTVTTDPRTPTSFALTTTNFQTVAQTSDLQISWTDPANGCPASVYTLLLTYNPKGIAATSASNLVTVSVPKAAGCSAGNLLGYTHDLIGLTLGAVVSARLCAGTVAVCGDPGSSVDWTLERVLQVAIAPSAPIISSLVFLDKTLGADTVELLIRFSQTYNGGTPSTGSMSYSLEGSSVEIASTPVAGNSYPTQLAVIANIPVNAMHDFTVVVRSTALNGLVGMSTNFESPISGIHTSRFKVPLPPQDLLAELEVPASGAVNYSALVGWSFPAEEVGNAPVLYSVLLVRTLHFALPEPATLAGELLTSTISVVRPRLDVAEYVRTVTTPGVANSFAVPSLPLGTTSCFVTRAVSAIGTSNYSTNEVCIDVQHKLRASCEIGTILDSEVEFTCSRCPSGTFSGRKGAAGCVDCETGKYTPATGATACLNCGANTYSPTGASSCDACGTVGMDCTGGVLRLLPGWWYGGGMVPSDNPETLTGTSTVYPCLNPESCSTINDTLIECALNTGGPLCGVCDAGYVPDGASEDGSCRECASSSNSRWLQKAILFAIGIFAFFIFALVLALRPATTLKLDPFLSYVMTRVRLRRWLKRAMLRLHDKDSAAAKLPERKNEKVRMLIKTGKFDVFHALRRLEFGVIAVGTAAVASEQSIASGITDNLVEQVTQTAEENFEQALDQAIGNPDTDFELEEGVGGNAMLAAGLMSAASQLGGDVASGAVNGCLDGIKAQLISAALVVKTLVVQVLDNLSMGQFKVLIGNLQINSSFDAVFSIPWPPIFTKFQEFMSIFKLDVFKGLSFAIPCLHSTHTMGILTFTLLPLALILAAALALVTVVLLRFCVKRSSAKTRRAIAHMPCGMGKCKVQSAVISTFKIVVVILLFVYPALCSKLFTTFKCVEVGPGELYMVADMTKQCYVGDWLLWGAVSLVGMIFYVVGIPVAIIVFLWIGQKKQALRFPVVELPEDIDMIEPRMVWSFVERTDNYLLNKGALGNVYEQYDPEAWYFEAACTFRKMILTGALVLFGAGTAAQVVVALAVCIFWFGLVANQKPYEDDTDDRLAQVEAMQVLFTLLIGLVLQLQRSAAKNGEQEFDNNSLGIALIGLNCVVIALALVQQPICRKIGTCFYNTVNGYKQRADAMRHWEKGLLVEVDDERYYDDDINTHDSSDIPNAVWVDGGDEPPRIIHQRPLAMKIVEDDRSGTMYFNALDGMLINDPICIHERTGKEYWFDKLTNVRLEVAPLHLHEIDDEHTVATAQHWFDETVKKHVGPNPKRAMLFERPTQLVLPHMRGNHPLLQGDCKDAVVRTVWHNKKTGELSYEDPHHALAVEHALEPRCCGCLHKSPDKIREENMAPDEELREELIITVDADIELGEKLTTASDLIYIAGASGSTSKAEAARMDAEAVEQQGGRIDGNAIDVASEQINRQDDADAVAARAALEARKTKSRLGADAIAANEEIERAEAAVSAEARQDLERRKLARTQSKHVAETEAGEGAVDMIENPMDTSSAAQRALRGTRRVC